jgi:hypothetical protein
MGERISVTRLGWGILAVFFVQSFSAVPIRAQTYNYEFNDSHFHLTNNIQEGPNIRDFLQMMGNKAGRVALFGVRVRAALDSQDNVSTILFSDSLRSLLPRRRARFRTPGYGFWFHLRRGPRVPGGDLHTEGVNQ